MFVNIYYLLRSRQDGSYLVARPNVQSSSPSSSLSSPQSSEPLSGKPFGDRPDISQNPGYLIVFREHADSLSYLNTHAPDLASDFAVESMSQIQLKAVMQRLQFQGIGLVSDPFLPQVQFMRQ